VLVQYRGDYWGQGMATVLKIKKVFFCRP